MDIAGNVYCGGPGGIYVMDPQGKKLGRIVHGNPQTTNIAFGGDDWKTLYFTSRTDAGLRQGEDSGRPGAGAEAIVGRGTVARLLVPGRKRSQHGDDEQDDRGQAGFDQAVAAKLPQRILPRRSVGFLDQPGREPQTD